MAEPRPFGTGTARNAGGDASGALHCDVKAGQAVLAQRALYRGLDAEEDAIAGVRPRIAADRAVLTGSPATYFVDLRDLDHVGDVDADILGGHVAPPRPSTALPKAASMSGVLVRSAVGEHHGLAAAERQSRHRILVAHSARQAQRIVKASSSCA